MVVSHPWIISQSRVNQTNQASGRSSESILAIYKHNREKLFIMNPHDQNFQSPPTSNDYSKHLSRDQHPSDSFRPQLLGDTHSDTTCSRVTLRDQNPEIPHRIEPREGLSRRDSSTEGFTLLLKLASKIKSDLKSVLPSKRGEQIFLTASLLLPLSLLFPTLRQLWQNLDQGLYEFFQKTLHSSAPWAHFWSWMSADITDRLQDTLIIAFTAAAIFGKEMISPSLWESVHRTNQSNRLSLFYPPQINSSNPSIRIKARAKHFFAYYLTFTLCAIAMKALINQYCDYHRLSPSYIDADAFSLQNLCPFRVKDRSSSSFPADHALFLFLWGNYYLRWGVAQFKRCSATLLVVLFSLPRLISGAHWLTDILFGGIIPAYLFYLTYRTFVLYQALKREGQQIQKGAPQKNTSRLKTS